MTNRPRGKALMVEADGYLPEVFSGFERDDEPVEHAFRLRRADAITGIVSDPEGRPVAGATVVQSDTASDFQFGNLNAYRPNPERSITTDAEGRYSFPPREKPFGVVVRHERGYGWVWPSDMARSADVRLRPWSRIEDAYRQGDRAVADAEITIIVDDMTPTSPEFLSAVYRATTDAEGRFSIEQMLPGIAVASTPTVGPVSFEMKPGTTTRVTLGGTGRTVVGRVALPEGTTLPFPMDRDEFSRLLLDRPEFPIPEGYSAMSPAQKRARNAAWIRTPEGRAWKLAYQGNAVQVSADGSFRAVDVRPGTYKLSIHLGEPKMGLGRYGNRTEVTATAERTVVVPEGPAGEAVDLGTVELTVSTRQSHVLQVGELAPEIAGAITLDGRPLQLADSRGKYILLNFWGSSYGPDQEPEMKPTWRTFKDDPRVAIIGLTLDDDAKVTRERARAQGLDWVQGVLGAPTKERVLDA